jgi:hypothetical protein
MTIKICVVCDDEFEAKGLQKTCSLACRHIHLGRQKSATAKRRSERYIKRIAHIKCQVCGIDFQTEVLNRLTCSEECAVENGKKWYRENPEKARAAGKAWRDANPEKVRANTRKWQIKNPERVKFLAKRWAGKNPEKVKASAKRAYEKKKNAKIQMRTFAIRYCENDQYLVARTGTRIRKSRNDQKSHLR